MEHRIVSISQPWLRPIVRGKAKAPVESGAKFGLSLDSEGYGRIKKISFEAYNESGGQIKAVERFRERAFSLSKRCYGMKCIVTKLEETQFTSIALSVFVTNLFKIQKRILCTIFHLIKFLHKWNGYKNWNLQISA